LKTPQEEARRILFAGLRSVEFGTLERMLGAHGWTILFDALARSVVDVGPKALARATERLRRSQQPTCDLEL
jgi:hypothetical protein